MTKKETNENVVKINLQQNGNLTKVILEGSIKDWVMIMTDVAENHPEFKKAVIISAQYFEYDFENDINYTK